MSSLDPTGTDERSDGNERIASEFQAEGATIFFEGDVGVLPLDTRQALTHLLIGPAIDGRRQPKLWNTLVRDEVVIRTRLCDVFLTLIMDLQTQVAFTRQAQSGTGEFPRLLRRSQLTFLDSVLLIHLRERLARSEAHGERAAVSESEMLEDLALYERAVGTDRAGFTNRTKAAIEKVKSNAILHKIRGSESRYEISTTLKILFSIDQLEELKSQYHKLAESTLVEARETEPSEGEA